MERITKSRFFEFVVTSKKSTTLLIPLYEHTVAAGFPSPADDYLEEQIDLNRYLVKNASSTFYAKVKGNSMKDANIHDGSLLVIDRSVKPKKNSICLCILDGEFTVKRIRHEKDATYLVPANPEFTEIKIEEGRDFEIWGVVIHVIHNTY